MTRNRTMTILAAIAVWISASPAAQAHKLKAFATVEGATINGYAYFTPGGRAQQADVTVAGPGDVEVLKTGVDAQGNFHFVAKQRIDYTVTVDGGDAHIAKVTVHAAELPDTLPLPENGQILPLDQPKIQADPAAPSGGDAAPPAPSAEANSAATEPTAVDAAALRTMIETSVARQINPLREQLDAFQEQVTWHDVLGGIGYIFGLFGVAYGFANRKARAPRSDGAAQAKAEWTG